MCDNFFLPNCTGNEFFLLILTFLGKRFVVSFLMLFYRWHSADHCSGTYTHKTLSLLYPISQSITLEILLSYTLFFKPNWHYSINNILTFQSYITSLNSKGSLTTTTKKSHEIKANQNNDEMTIQWVFYVNNSVCQKNDSPPPSMKPTQKRIRIF